MTRGRSVKKYIALMLVVCFAAAGFLFELAAAWCAKRLPDQNLAPRYGSGVEFAQITLIAADDAAFSKNYLPAIRGSIGKNFGAANPDLVQGETIVDGRPFIDAYSAKTKYTYKTDKTAAEIDTIGVGGDFFMFHPWPLVSGSYFSESTDENGDGLILNELAAWQLFGALDVAGMYLLADNEMFMIRGVVAEDEGLFAKAAGQNEPRAYIAFDSMERMAGSGDDGMDASVRIGCYEVLIYNPVKDFGLNVLKDAAKEAMLDPKYFSVVVNSERFSYVNRILLIKDFFKRVMNTTDVIYPFWENRARAVEQLAMLLMALQLICYLAALVLFVAGLISIRDDIKRFRLFVRGKLGDLKELITAGEKKVMDKRAAKSAAKNVPPKEDGKG